MPSVAEQLRHGREKRNLSVPDVAEVTKIRTDHIRALEEGRYEVFAAPVYIRGFVRSYARLLKLEVPQIMQELEAELSGTEHFREPGNLAGKPHSAVDLITLQLAKVNWQWVGLIFVLGLLLTFAIVGFRLWQNHKAADPLADLGPGLYQPAQTNTGEMLPLQPPATSH